MLNKTYLKRNFLPGFFTWLFSLFLRTVSIKQHNKPVDIETGKIYATWHGRILASFAIEDRDSLNLLISKSNDGEMISRTVLNMGFKVIRGSASRGGRGAAKQMIEKLEQKESIFFTVDGPRGPVYKVKTAVLKLAQKTGAPIIPVVVHSKPGFIFNTWDRYLLPFFFSKIDLYHGSPIYVNEDATEEELESIRVKLEEEMLRLTDDKKR